MPSGPAPTVGTGNSVTSPDVVIRAIPLPGFILPILDVPLSQNQRCRSGPNTMIYGLLCGVGIGCRTISTSAIEHCPCTAAEESGAVMRSHAAGPPELGPFPQRDVLYP